MSIEWHKSEEFQKSCREFHDACARQPCGNDVDQAKEILEMIKPYIAEIMAKQGIFGLKRYEHRGSTYEGVKIAKSATDQDLEFDVMFVIDGGRDLECHELELGGFVKSDSKPRELFQKTKERNKSYISATKTKNLFYKHLVGCKLEELEIYFKGSCITCKLFYHGPATKVDVYRDQEKFFTLDLAPLFDLSGTPGDEEMYIAKAKKKRSPRVKWLRTYSLDEKRKFDGMDRDNGCRKMILRTMKAFVKSRPELSWLTSQHLKTALFITLDAKRSWTQEEFGQRFMDALGTLRNCLKEKNLPSYFQPDVNLFERYKEGTMHCTRNRFRRLSNNGSLMMKLLSANINK